jgi:hypothetical protein
MRPYLKKSVTKIGLAEWLKVKALGSSPSITKKKKKKKKKRKGAGPSPLHGHAPSDLKISQSSHLLKVPPPASRAQLVTKLLTHGPLEAT